MVCREQNGTLLRLMGMRYFIVLLLGGVWFSAPGEQVLPDNMHSLPVLIEITHANKTSYGTGIYLSTSDNAFLVTAAHVIFNPTNLSELVGSNATLSSFALEKGAMEKLVFQVNLQLLNDWGLIKRHPLHDVAVLSIAKLGKMGTNGRLQTELSLAVTNCSPTIRNWAGWPTDACVLFGGIDDASDAYILEYPVELLNDRLPLEVDFTSPLVRKGVISQRNPQLLT